MENGESSPKIKVNCILFIKIGYKKLKFKAKNYYRL